MSNVKAYRCDNCREIFTDEYIYGIIDQVDFFDIWRSYPTEYKHKNFENCKWHVCTYCVSKHVLQRAKEIDENGRERFDDAVRRLRYEFYSNVIQKTKNLKK